MAEEKKVFDVKRPVFDVREVGRVKSVKEFIVTAVELPSCVNGQILELADGTKGLVMGFDQEEVQILLLGSSSVGAGDKVFNRGKTLKLPVGEQFVGRVVDSLCRPQDSLGPIKADDDYPVFRGSPPVLDRKPVDKTLETGTLVLDAIIPIAKGQRQLLIGDRLTGKTSVGADAILNQKGKGVICIYACIGKPYSALVKAMELFRAGDALDYLITVSGVASLSTGEQYLAPYTACMLAEYFMYKGKDVLVILDDLTKHAWIYRQISLLLERAPGREAYPGDIFYVHSQLMERAAYLKSELGGGSMTLLPVVEILQGDVTGYIPTNLVSMTDGQIYFSTDLFNKGFKPAIDFGLSVSRIGNKAQWPAMRQVSKNLRLDYIQYLELLKMTQLSTAGLSKEAEAKIKKGEAINQLIIQNKNKPISIEEQIMYLYALNKGILENISLKEIKQFKKDFIRVVKEKEPELISELRREKKITESIEDMLNECIKLYFAGKSTGEGG